MQYELATHWLLSLQLCGHPPALPWHRNGAHAGDPASPAASARHVPSCPVTLHASHAPGHPVSQQYPSAQCPVAHCRARVQLAPGPKAAVHVPALQKNPAAHSPSPPQLTGQLALVPLHTYGAHPGSPALPAAATVQAPGIALQTSHAPLHPVWQQYPSTQNPLAHSRARLHASPAARAPTHALPLQ